MVIKEWVEKTVYHDGDIVSFAGDFYRQNDGYDAATDYDCKSYCAPAQHNPTRQSGLQRWKRIEAWKRGNSYINGDDVVYQNRVYRQRYDYGFDFPSTTTPPDHWDRWKILPRDVPVRPATQAEIVDNRLDNAERTLIAHGERIGRLELNSEEGKTKKIIERAFDNLSREVNYDLGNKPWGKVSSSGPVIVSQAEFSRMRDEINKLRRDVKTYMRETDDALGKVKKLEQALATEQRLNQAHLGSLRKVREAIDGQG